MTLSPLPHGQGRGARHNQVSRRPGQSFEPSAFSIERHSSERKRPERSELSHPTDRQSSDKHTSQTTDKRLDENSGHPESTLKRFEQVVGVLRVPCEISCRPSALVGFHPQLASSAHVHRDKACGALKGERESNRPDDDQCCSKHSSLHEKSPNARVKPPRGEAERSA
jgi:hypothetical protein